MKDLNGVQVINGSIIDIHQTVNGESKFIVFDVESLDVRYSFDLKRVYEYDVKDLFKPCEYSGEVEFEVIGNIYDIMNR